MADTKITGLTNFDSSNTPYWPPAPASDVIPIVDISDATMAASGTTKKISINNLLSSSPTATGALTVTGLVTAGSATITGAATVGTTLGVTGVSTLTGAVGVGNTPIGKFDVYNTVSDTTVFIRSDTTKLGQIVFRDNADAGNQGKLKYDHLTDTLSLSAGGNENLFLSSTGNLSLATGNLVMSTSGKGIDFSAVTGGTGTATGNVLNDYEEGTWTPAYSPTTGAFTTLPTVGSGKYRKIGDTVFFSIAIRTAGTVVLGAASGDIQITGFPFTCSAAGGNGTSSLFQQFNLAVSSAHLGISITGSTTIATITKNLSNGSVTYVQANELSTATGNFENLIYAFGMYNV